VTYRMMDPVLRKTEASHLAMISPQQFGCRSLPRKIEAVRFRRGCVQIAGSGIRRGRNANKSQSPPERSILVAQGVDGHCGPHDRMLRALLNPRHTFSLAVDHIDPVISSNRCYTDRTRTFDFHWRAKSEASWKAQDMYTVVATRIPAWTPHLCGYNLAPLGG